MSQRNYLFLRNLFRKGTSNAQINDRCLVKDFLSVLRIAYHEKYTGGLRGSLGNKRIEPTGNQPSSVKELASPTLIDKHFREISENPLLSRKITPTQFAASGNVCYGSGTGKIDAVINSFQDEVAAGQATESKALHVLKSYYNLIKMPPETRNEKLIKQIAAGSKVLSWLRASNTEYRYLYRDMICKHIYAEGGFPAVSEYMREECKRMQERRVPPVIIDYWKTTLLTISITFHLNRGDQISTVLDIMDIAKSADSPFKLSHSSKYEFIKAERSIIMKLLSVDKTHLDDQLVHRFLTMCVESPEYWLIEALIFTKTGSQLPKRFNYVKGRLLDPDMSLSIVGWQRQHFIKLTLDIAEELLEANKHNDSAWLLSAVKASFPTCFDIDLDKADRPISWSKSFLPTKLPTLDRLAGFG